MKRTLLFIACILTSITMMAQEETNDYLPFVELGKQWHVFRSKEYWMMEEVERDSKTYVKTYFVDDDYYSVADLGLFREEDRRVYKYDETLCRDIMLYDFSLKEGDTFTYEYGLDQPVINKTPQDANNPEVSDVQNSGCTNRTRASISQTLVLTKEGDIVTCEINGIYSNCGVSYFDIQSEYTKGMDAPDSLFINVTPVIPLETDCTCPYNVSFTIRNVKSDSFYLCCFPYAGIMSFKESNQIVLELSSERVTIAGSQYFLFKPGQLAQLLQMNNLQGEVQIPSTVSYDGQDYTVSSFIPDAIGGGMTKLFIPKTIRDLGYSEFVNTINARNPSIESIEVESGCSVLSTVDGVLYSGDRKALYCLPAGKKLIDYSVIDGVETIGAYAFSCCPNLKTIMLPKSVTTIREYAFAQSNNLESIYIPGKLNKDILWWAFSDMPSTVTLYVPESDIDDYKAIYKGPVLPISSSGEMSEMAYRPFIEEDKVWVVKAISSWPEEEWLECFYFDGDTIIDGQSAKRMMVDRVHFTESENTYREYVGAFYEKDKKVYGILSYQRQFDLLYDFTLSTGDIISDIYGLEGEDYLKVTKMSGSIPSFKGVYYELQYTYNTTIGERWLEGVGSEYYPWLNLRGGWGGNMGVLLECSVGDEVIYYNSEEADPYVSGARKQRIDFTHTTKIKPKTRSEDEQSLYGEYNEQQLSINLSPISDAYLVSITDESGKAVYEKSINASSIVGLNIDISAYAEGRYTATVENSNESFIGEFYAQTTGIKEVRPKKEDTRMHIYNLQGQRLNSLQKGLNIVNGQKVYVK